MKINFDMDINVSDWAEAIGYTVVGDKVVSKNVFALSDFEECISDYISESIECGVNSGVIVERFFANDDEQHGLRDMLEECERVETIPSVVEEITDISSLTREEKLAFIVDGADAVFLPERSTDVRISFTLSITTPRQTAVTAPLRSRSSITIES